MFHTGELIALLNRGREVQKTLKNTLIKAPDTASLPESLLGDIEQLIKLIKPYLIAPSSTEKNEMGLAIIKLASILKNLNNIKHTIFSY